MRMRRPIAGFRPLAWLALASLLAQHLLPVIRAMASIQSEDAEAFGRARLVAPAKGERLSLGYQFHIASSREQAMKEAGNYYEENMKMFGELRLVRALSDGS